MALGSAVLLGIYDVAKKYALRRNGVLWILLIATGLSTIFLSPFLGAAPFSDHLKMIFKAVLVTTSWISGLAALKTLPLTTASTIKASRPVFVVLFSIILFGERLNITQWLGVVFTITALYLLSRSSKKEGIAFTHDKGVWLMGLSVLTGVASALYDKHIITGLEPLWVQSWANFYITAMLAICILVQALRPGDNLPKFKWDWSLVLIAVFITAADALYFFALKQDGAMLSVISMLRRCSVVVTFVLGAAIFREHNIRAKGAELLLVLAGMALLLLGTN